MNLLKVCTAGTTTAIATITLPDPDNGGANREMINSMVDEESLNYTRHRDIVASKFQYKMTYTYMPKVILEELLTYLAGNYDFYFQSDRWDQTASYMLVFPSISGDTSSAGTEFLQCTLTMVEGVAR